VSISVSSVCALPTICSVAFSILVSRLLVRGLDIAGYMKVLGDITKNSSIEVGGKVACNSQCKASCSMRIREETDVGEV